MAQGGGRTDAAGDTVIVRAAIYPAIGIGRVGNSPDQFFCGPEVSYPTPQHPGFYRDANGALKRQAARFRIYGYNAAGDVVAELTTANSSIAWSAQLRNEKAAWYEFQLAMDIPEVEHAKPANRRNAEVKGEDRTKLMIDGDTVAIAGASQSGPAYRFNGEIFGIPVYLGELQTDAAGRLIVLGGQGVSASYAEQPLKDFSNNDTWYDDTADGPVTAGDDRRHDGAGRSRMGRDRPAELRPEPEDRAHDVRSAVRPVCAVRPAAGAEPGLVHPRHPADLPTDERAPVGQRRFHRAFGYRAPLDFDDPKFLLEISQTDGKMEVPRQIANSFRNFQLDGYSRTPLPWIYGDAVSIKQTTDIHQNCALSATQLACLRQWARGEFLPDYEPGVTPPGSLDQVPLGEQPAMLDRAALEFCLADAFHPGCEITWPIRHTTMFMAPFRIRHGAPPVDYGDVLTPEVALGPLGPLHGQNAGGLSRWMAVPWQADTASCRSGYDKDYDPYLPTFWPARVPNQILYVQNYLVAIDPMQPPELRRAAFNTRPNWYDAIPGKNQQEQIAAMIHYWPYLGLVEQRPGATGEPDLPVTMQVSTSPSPLSFPTEPGPVIDPPMAAAMAAHARATVAPRRALRPVGRAVRLAQGRRRLLMQ